MLKTNMMYSGKYYEGGTYMDADAPIDRIPVYVREGSVIPMSSDISYADEKNGLPDVIRVYEGRDGEFRLYVDDGQYCEVTFAYSEAGHKLSVSKSGSYPVPDEFAVEYIGK